MKTHRIRDRSYFSDIVLAVGTDVELERWIRRRRWKLQWNGVCGKYVRVAGDLTHYVLISTKSRGSWRLAVLGHEVLHLTFAVLQGAGVELCDGSEEAFTYFFQGMFAECLRRL